MRRSTPLFVLCALLALEVHAAHAQVGLGGQMGQGGQAGRASRPYRGLFGSGVDQDAGQVLAVNVAAGGGYDDNLLAEASGAGGIGRTGAIQGGRLGTVTGALNYSSVGDRARWGASLAVATRFYPDVEPHTLSSRNFSINSTNTLTARTTMTVGANASYRPFWMGALFAASDASFTELSQTDLVAVDPTNLDRSGNFDEYLTYGGTLTLNHRLSNRTTANAAYTYRGADAKRYSGRFQQQMIRGGVQRQFTQALALDLGYTLRRSEYGPTNDRDDHIVNIGINYNRTLSFSRRTSLSFATGTSAVENDRRRIFRATGAATLAHEMGRSWTASASYNRGLRFLETISEPVFADSANVVVGGLLHRRLNFTSSFHASLGNFGRSNIDTRATNLLLSYGLTPNVSIQATYGYFQYEFGSGAPLPAGVPPLVERQSVKLQVALWAPIFQRARRSNAAR